MKPNNGRWLLVLLLALAALLAQVQPAAAGRKFSPDDDGYYFYRACRDGVELYNYWWNSDNDDYEVNEGYTNENFFRIGVFLGELNDDFTDEVLDQYTVENREEIIRYLADVTITKRESASNRLNLDEVDAASEIANVRISDSEGMRYWGKAVVTWPTILDVGSPLILYNWRYENGLGTPVPSGYLTDILDTDTEDLPRVDDCYILAQNRPAPVAEPAAEPAAAPVTEPVEEPVVKPAAPDTRPAAPKITARVTAERLNVREGPGANTPIVARVYLDEVYYAVARNAAGDWVQLRVPELAADSGWVAAQYVALSAPAAQLPVYGAQAAVTAGSGGGQANKATPEPPAAAPAAPEPAAPKPVVANVTIGAGVLVDGFEKWGTWARGDEAWGTFAQSDDDVHSGSFAGRLDYDFPSVANNYVVFRQARAIAGAPDALGIWVKGDGSTHFLNVWLQDAKGQLWQYSFGRINHTGWQQMVTPLGPPGAWPSQPIGAVTTAEPVMPVKFYALVLDGHAEDRTSAGTVYVDQLEAFGN